MRITADRAICVGAGQCALVAPGLFDQDDDGLVLVLDPADADGAADRPTADRAASLCPVRAIRVDD